MMRLLVYNDVYNMYSIVCMEFVFSWKDCLIVLEKNQLIGAVILLLLEFSFLT